MKTIKWIIPVLAGILLAASCKKDEAENEFGGLWNVREQQYYSPDTTYTDDFGDGYLTYEFKSDQTYHMLSPGIADVTGTWKRRGNDSIWFSNQPSWQILGKNENDFRAKYYTTASTYFVLKLQR